MKRASFLLPVLLFAYGSTASAQLSGPDNPDSLSVQGRLTDLVGDPVADGTYDIVFTLYKNSSNVWQESHSDVPVGGGVFNVVLGTSTSLGDVPFDQPMELGIKVDTDSEISPRVPLTGAAYALGLRGLYAVDADDGTNVAPNLIGGAPVNSVAAGVVGATIGGGGGTANAVAGPQSVVQDWGTVSGGLANTASGHASTVGGGYSNTAFGDSATVAGGAHNVTEWEGATIGGGSGNVAWDYATISGGQENTADGTYSVIAGGRENHTSATRSAIGGGNNNTAGGSRSVIAGGSDNMTSGVQSVIGGGTGNIASGKYSTIPGGDRNDAVGHASTAMGTLASALHAGSFVFQDSTGASGFDLSTTSQNQFLARASGGVTFLTAGAPNLTTGAYLAPGSGSWSELSSESSKTDFKPIDPGEYLERAAGLDIRQWSYKTESGVTHVGPMAEDFYAAFGHGPSERSITTVDASGVALAAIQGLYELVKEQQAEIERLRRIIGND